MVRIRVVGGTKQCTGCGRGEDEKQSASAPAGEGRARPSLREAQVRWVQH